MNDGHRGVDEQWEIGAVLVVEDDDRSSRLMRAIIESVSRRVEVVHTAAAALDAVSESDFDLITIDLGLPDLGGRDLLHQIKQMTDTPVIIVTALGQSSSAVQTLMDGADDYIVKPVRPAELRARMRAVTRRTHGSSVTVDHYTDDTLRIDFSRSEVVTSAGIVPLRPTERRLLRELVSQVGAVLTHDELLRRVWGAGYEHDSAILRLYIGYLRKKIDIDASAPSRIRTHRGVGYEFLARPPAT